MIEDREMRELFRVESDQHLQQLDLGLLRLEKEPDDRALVEDLFREAHSLKGASRMLGLVAVETLTHRFEEILGKARNGELVLRGDIIDPMYRYVDAIRRLVREAVTGEKAGVAVGSLLSLLRPETLRSGPDTAERSARELSRDEEGAADGASASVSTEGERRETERDDPVPALLEPLVIETVRVETHKLDLVMDQAAELAVVKQRVTRRCLDVEALIERWECLARQALPGGEEGEEPRREFSAALARLRGELLEDASRLAAAAGEVGASALSMRLLPLSNVFNLFPRLVRDLAREQGKEARLVILGGETEVDKRILEEIKAPLTHVIRNAVGHGIERGEKRVLQGKGAAGTITLSGARRGASIVIEVADDGGGLDTEAIREAAATCGKWHGEALAAMSTTEIQRLIFSPGLSTTSFVTDLSGRGVGLDVVRCNVERLKGEVAVSSTPGEGCRITITLPVTLATVRVLVVRAEGVEYALPVEYVVKTYRLRKEGIFTIDGRPAAIFGERTISVASLAELLPCRRRDFAAPAGQGEAAGERDTCVIVRVSEEPFALLVDELLEEQEVVIKPQCVLLEHVHGTAGATILDSGTVCMILHPPDLLQALRSRPAPAPPQRQETGTAPASKKRVLVAEDSLTTRTQLKRILDGAGYEVVTAVDGVDALAKLAGRPFDALVTDVTMPRMDGLALTAKVRQNANFKELPVILVTMLVSEDDKRKGLEAGANAYITKPAFEQKLLLDTLRRLA
jgi:two-component system, chemotaxis family, sensor kinase CheA